MQTRESRRDSSETRFDAGPAVWGDDEVRLAPEPAPADEVEARRVQRALAEVGLGPTDGGAHSRFVLDSQLGRFQPDSDFREFKRLARSAAF